MTNDVLISYSRTNEIICPAYQIKCIGCIAAI